MNLDQRAIFRQIVDYFNKNLNYLGRDLTFLLGFYVSLVAKRWWDQYRLLPWPDNLAMNLTGESNIWHCSIIDPTSLTHRCMYV